MYRPMQISRRLNPQKLWITTWISSYEGRSTSLSSGLRSDWSKIVQPNDAFSVVSAAYAQRPPATVRSDASSPAKTLARQGWNLRSARGKCPALSLRSRARRTPRCRCSSVACWPGRAPNTQTSRLDPLSGYRQQRYQKLSTVFSPTTTTSCALSKPPGRWKYWTFGVSETAGVSATR